MQRLTPLFLAALAAAGILAAGPAAARDQIRIAGSSTVYPFATVVAEAFGRAGGFKTPVVESTGTGGGIKLFCAGATDKDPDIANASRAITASEIAQCAANGIRDIIEVKIGFDGIVLANARAAPQLKLSLKQLWIALAKQVPDKDGRLIANPYKNWRDIDPSFPNTKIEVMGPPPTSGTRDALANLGLSGGCVAFPAVAALQTADAAKFTAVCQTVREDGGYIEAGEDDVLIVKKLQANANAFGLFGFSYLEQNRDAIQASAIEGVAATTDTIASGKYALSRPLFFYVKKSRLGAVPGIEAYIKEFVSEKAFGPDGYLVDRGLIALPDAERKKVQSAALALTPNVM